MGNGGTFSHRLTPRDTNVSWNRFQLNAPPLADCILSVQKERLMTRYSTTLIQARATSLATLLSVGLIVASSTTAATIQFDNGSTDGLWETAANWNPDGVPTSADN